MSIEIDGKMFHGVNHLICQICNEVVLDFRDTNGEVTVTGLAILANDFGGLTWFSEDVDAVIHRCGTTSKEGK